MEIKLKKYDAYKDSGVKWLGEIPEGWELTRLGTRFEERRTKVSDKDFEPLSVTKNGILPQLDNAAKSNDGDNRKLVKKGDFVINSRSDRKGSSGISDRDGSVSLINIVIEPKNFNPIYCNYLLKSQMFVEEYYRMGHGIVADLWTTRYDEMKAILIGIPSVEEQTAIANFLDDKTAKIDQSIRIKQEQIVLLKERRQILIHKAVTRGLDKTVKLKDSGVAWIGKIPEHWEVKRFTKEVFVQEGPGIMAVDFMETGIPLIRISGVKGEYLTLEGCNYLNPTKVKNKWKHFRLELNDLIISGSASTELISEVSLETVGCICYTGLIRLKPFNMDKEYLKIFLGSKLFFTQIELLKTGSTISHYGPSHLGQMVIVLPSKEEQMTIAGHVKTLSKKIRKGICLKEKEIDKLKEYKASLINSVVTGKVRVI